MFEIISEFTNMFHCITNLRVHSCTIIGSLKELGFLIEGKEQNNERKSQIYIITYYNNNINCY